MINKTMVFCTLFNSGYLDKGIVMFKSLQKVTNDFRLYIFAFDDQCYEILQNYKCEQLIPVSLKEFENEQLLAAKNNRTYQEYCWTCSCHSIKHVLEVYKEDVCTYIDADMFFYNDPKVLFDEIERSKCDVSIIEHRLTKGYESERIEKLSGKYCIEFNTFFSTPNGLKILNWWCDRCLELCTSTPDGEHFGDQKYLDDWTERFEGVHVLEHIGAGVAPWNIAQYKAAKNENGCYKIIKGNATADDLVFYHFQAMKYIDDHTVDIGINLYPKCAQKELFVDLYKNYLHEIEDVRDELKVKYGLKLDYIRSSKFNKMDYFKNDILGERRPDIIMRKIWRLVIRKERDYINF